MRPTGAIGNARERERSTHPVGGCDFAEDPDRDAREATPVWLAESGASVRLSPYADEPVALRFSLWSFAGRKALVHDGRRLLLTGSARSAIRQVRIDNELSHGMRYGYLVPSGRKGSQYQAALADAIALGSGHGGEAHWMQRPSRDAVFAMHALQALDGAAARASQRAIACALFGSGATQKGWTPDGELRAKVRYLLKRARALRDGGYRALLQSSTDRTEARN